MKHERTNVGCRRTVARTLLTVLCLLTSVLCLLTGCATHRDAPIDANPPPATVIGGGVGEPDAMGRHKEYVCFVEVDGKPTVSTFAHALFAPYPREVRIPPGGHGLTARYVVGGGFAHAQLWLDAMPGRTYVVDPVRTNDKVLLRITLKAEGN